MPTGRFGGNVLEVLGALAVVAGFVMVSYKPGGDSEGEEKGYERGVGDESESLNLNSSPEVGEPGGLGESKAGETLKSGGRSLRLTTL